MGIFGKRDPFKNLFERTNGLYWHLNFGGYDILQTGRFSEVSYMCDVNIISKTNLSKEFSVFIKTAISNYSKQFTSKKESHPLGEKIEMENYPLDYFDFKVNQRELDCEDGDIKKKVNIPRKEFHVTVFYSIEDLGRFYFLPTNSGYQEAVNLKIKSGSGLEFSLWNLCSEFPQVLTALKLKIEFTKGKNEIEKVKLVLPNSMSVWNYSVSLKSLGFK